MARCLAPRRRRLRERLGRQHRRSSTPRHARLLRGRPRMLTRCVGLGASGRGRLSECPHRPPPLCPPSGQLSTPRRPLPRCRTADAELCSWPLRQPRRRSASHGHREPGRTTETTGADAALRLWMACAGEQPPACGGARRLALITAADRRRRAARLRLPRAPCGLVRGMRGIDRATCRACRAVHRGTIDPFAADIVQTSHRRTLWLHLLH